MTLDELRASDKDFLTPADVTNWPIKDIRETVSKACGYDEHLYLKHSGNYGKDNSPIGRQTAERIAHRIWG